MAASAVAPPSGYTLEEDKPNLPEGYTLEGASKPTPTSQATIEKNLGPPSMAGQLIRTASTSGVGSTLNREGRTAATMLNPVALGRGLISDLGSGGEAGVPGFEKILQGVHDVLTAPDKVAAALTKAPEVLGATAGIVVGNKMLSTAGSAAGSPDIASVNDAVVGPRITKVGQAAVRAGARGIETASKPAVLGAAGGSIIGGALDAGRGAAEGSITGGTIGRALGNKPLISMPESLKNFGRASVERGASPSGAGPGLAYAGEDYGAMETRAKAELGPDAPASAIRERVSEIKDALDRSRVIVGPAVPSSGGPNLSGSINRRQLIDIGRERGFTPEMTEQAKALKQPTVLTSVSEEGEGVGVRSRETIESSSKNPLIERRSADRSLMSPIHPAKSSGEDLIKTDAEPSSSTTERRDVGERRAPEGEAKAGEFNRRSEIDRRKGVPSSHMLDLPGVNETMNRYMRMSPAEQEEIEKAAIGEEE